MAQFTYKDIEEFLLDDDFFQWARYGSSDNGFNLESYKLQQHLIYLLAHPDFPDYTETVSQSRL